MVGRRGFLDGEPVPAENQQGTVWSSLTHTQRHAQRSDENKNDRTQLLPKYKYEAPLRLYFWNDLSYHNQSTGKTNAIFDLKREFTCYLPINLIQQKYLLCLTKQTYKSKSSNTCTSLTIFFCSIQNKKRMPCGYHLMLDTTLIYC